MNRTVRIIATLALTSLCTAAWAQTKEHKRPAKAKSLYSRIKRDLPRSEHCMLAHVMLPAILPDARKSMENPPADDPKQPFRTFSQQLFVISDAAAFLRCEKTAQYYIEGVRLFDKFSQDSMDPLLFSDNLEAWLGRAPELINVEVIPFGADVFSRPEFEKYCASLHALIDKSGRDYGAL